MFACGALPAGRSRLRGQLRHPPIADHLGGHPSHPGHPGQFWSIPESPVRGPSAAQRDAGRRRSVAKEQGPPAQGGFPHETSMNEFELQRLYEAELTAQIADERIPAHDRNAAGAVLAASGRLLGAMLRPRDEPRTVGVLRPALRTPGEHRHLQPPVPELSPRRRLPAGVVETRCGVPRHGALPGRCHHGPPNGRLDRPPPAQTRPQDPRGRDDNAHIRRLRRAFDEVAACAHLPGEPHLLFTHVPLDDIPAAA